MTKTSIYTNNTTYTKEIWKFLGTLFNKTGNGILLLLNEMVRLCYPGILECGHNVSSQAMGVIFLSFTFTSE